MLLRRLHGCAGLEWTVYSPIFRSAFWFRRWGPDSAFDIGSMASRVLRRSNTGISSSQARKMPIPFAHANPDRPRLPPCCLPPLGGVCLTPAAEIRESAHSRLGDECPHDRLYA